MGAGQRGGWGDVNRQGGVVVVVVVMARGAVGMAAARAVPIQGAQKKRACCSSAAAAVPACAPEHHRSLELLRGLLVGGCTLLPSQHTAEVAGRSACWQKCVDSHPLAHLLASS